MSGDSRAHRIFTICVQNDINKAIANKHHYVPEVYLKHFVDSQRKFHSSTPKSEYYNSPKQKYPSQVCYIRDFYKLEKKARENDHEYIEKKAFKYENRDIVKIFKLLKRKDTDITRSQHKKLLEIYLSFKNRNLYMRNFYRNHDILPYLDKEIERLRIQKDTIEKLAKTPFDEVIDRAKKTILADKKLPENWHKDAILRNSYGSNEPINHTPRKLSRFRMFVFEPAEKTSSSLLRIIRDIPWWIKLKFSILNMADWRQSVSP